MTTTDEAAIHVNVTLQDSLVTLPKSASDKLPSRGMVMVEGNFNGVAFQVLLQPNGQLSHWFTVSDSLRKAAGAAEGDSIELEMTPLKDWPEPKVPPIVQKALADDPEALARWMNVTPMARWDWLNWMDAVKQAETLQQRPAKLCSMLKAGKRRPCCFNRAIRMAPKTAVLRSVK